MLFIIYILYIQFTLNICEDKSKLIFRKYETIIMFKLNNKKKKITC